MLYREIIAVCSQIHTKHINTLCGQNGELLNVKPVVHIVTTELCRVDSNWGDSKLVCNGTWIAGSNQSFFSLCIDKQFRVSNPRCAERRLLQPYVSTVDRRHKDTYISALHTIASCVYISNYPSLFDSCLWKSHKTFVQNRLHIGLNINY